MNKEEREKFKNYAQESTHSYHLCFDEDQKIFVPAENKIKKAGKNQGSIHISGFANGTLHSNPLDENRFLMILNCIEKLS